MPIMFKLKRFNRRQRRSDRTIEALENLARCPARQGRPRVLHPIPGDLRRLVFCAMLAGRGEFQNRPGGVQREPEWQRP